ncbi:nuclear pore complex component-domain-containing protein [Xylariaceae sp. FL0016]|nr:nuclear pore complex component-domain-containing protein [Xylariaceae sp. FL0016]
MASAVARTLVSTPKKALAPSPVESPGSWRHPRLQEIVRRQEASTFSEKNARRIVIHITIFFGLIAVHTALGRILPSRRSFPSYLVVYSNYLYMALLAYPIVNIALNLLPILRPKDDLSDIPLTPGQRKLLGLPPSSAPPTPGSVYSTPPRYSRTPSTSGSAASKRSFSGSPISNRSPSNHGSPVGGSGGGFASPGNVLLQKAMHGARRSSIGSPSPLLGVSTSTSLFGGPESPSPSPSASKRSTVGLSNKWRYEKGMYDRGKDRRESSGDWMYA